MRRLGEMTIENAFIRGTERIQGVNQKNGNPYDFTVVRFDDETGADYEIRLEDDADVDAFVRRRDGVLTVSVYASNKNAFLKAITFEAYKER